MDTIMGPSFIAQSVISWYLFSLIYLWLLWVLYHSINLKLVLFCNVLRFKVVIQQELEQVDSQSGENHLQMNLNHIWIIQVEEFCLWPTLVQTLTKLSCKFYSIDEFFFLVNSSWSHFTGQISAFSFITYRSCRHLDNKHTVFGKVVGGLDTLTAMEQIEVDNKDRPIEDIVIERASVFVDPYQEADDQVCFDAPRVCDYFILTVPVRILFSFTACSRKSRGDQETCWRKGCFKTGCTPKRCSIESLSFRCREIYPKAR